ncbi:Alpha/Beta hydrolase protein [Aspergillus spectabilis]
MPFEPIFASVVTEGCDLHYWYQGAGSLLVFIPGGGGIGRQFNPLFEHLDKHFTVCTYDRRQTNASRVDFSKPLNPAQQARDIIAICKALGRERTSIFGNSGGGVIALQFAVSYPEYLDRVIVHEAPTTVLLDDATYHMNRAFMLLDVYRNSGGEAAMEAFRTEMRGFENSPPLSTPSADDTKNFWENEFMQFTIYCPDLRKIVKNGVAIGVAAGVKSADAFYARTTVPQSEILGCPRFMVPGHHNGYEAEPAAFAAELIKAMQVLEDGKNKKLLV